MAFSNKNIGAAGLALTLTIGAIESAERTRESAPLLSVMGQEQVDKHRARYEALCKQFTTDEILDGGRAMETLDRIEKNQVQVYANEGIKGQAGDWDCRPGFYPVGGIPKFE